MTSDAQRTIDGGDGLPRLEVRSRGASRDPSVPPILLVHGAWHGAWCWDRGFMDRLADAGHEVHALSLRGHGDSEGHDSLRTTRIRDYVADVARVAGSLRCEPLVVGHSMGGFVVQRYLEGRASPGGVLLASVPPTGVAPLLLKMTRTDPVAVLRGNLTLSLLPIIADAGRSRRLFFSADMPEAEVAAHHAQLGEEAFLGYIDMLCLDLAKPGSVRAPVTVLGAADDAIFPPAQVEATAAAYGAVAEFHAGMAHDMMLERGWEAVADRISEVAYASRLHVKNAGGSLAA